jgi:hypothetical protein
MNNVTKKVSHANLSLNKNQMTEIVLTIVFLAIIIWSGWVLLSVN